MDWTAIVAFGFGFIVGLGTLPFLNIVAWIRNVSH